MLSKNLVLQIGAVRWLNADAVRRLVAVTAWGGLGIGEVMVPRKKPSELTDGVMVAGLDLGSNSFHMLVARAVNGRLVVIDRLRENVRLAAGLGPDGHLTQEAQDRAITNLERFGQRLRHLPARRVRAVGTNTLRQAGNSAAFLVRARKALGHRIEIISGSEEARLIYLGVSPYLPPNGGRQLVVDIGGGSTECVIGEGSRVLRGDSLYMGCVSFTSRFFPDQQLSRERFREAEIAAQLELASIRQRFCDLGWEQAVGASGTILAVAEVLRANNWLDDSAAGPLITAKGLRKLRKALATGGDASSLKLAGLSDDRKAVFAGGVAILGAVFDSFGLRQMTTAQGALREGLLHDLLGRIHHEDIREQSVRQLAEIHRVDEPHAVRVEQTALVLFQQARSSWKLRDEHVDLLRWAARLHEVGLSVSYSGYHKHGAYLVHHADLPGFSRDDQALTAALIRRHRRKIKRERATGMSLSDTTLLRLAALLRLAVLLHRERSERPLPPFALAALKEQLHLSFPAEWLAAHPLTSADLNEEAQRLRGIDFTLTVG